MTAFNFDGAKLRAARERAGLTLDQLAARLRDIAVSQGGYTERQAGRTLSASWLSKVERGEHQPRYGAAGMLAKAMSVSMETFARRLE